MTRRLTVVLLAVMVGALLLAGTSYARSLSGQEEQEQGWATGCGGVAMDGMHSTMRASLAGSLGLTSDQLDEALASGKSLEQIASEQGLDGAELAERMLAAMKAALDEQVAEGTISREQAESMLAAANGHMTPEHIASMGGMSGMGGSDMDSMHDSMHGSGEVPGGSCHGGESGGDSGGGMMGSWPSMMGQRF